MCSWICMDSKIDLIHKDISSYTSDVISMVKNIFSARILRICFEITHRQAKEKKCILHTFSTFVFVLQLRLKQYTSKCTMIIFLSLCSMEAVFETIAIYMYFFKQIFDRMFPVTGKETYRIEKGDNSLLL